MRWRRPSTGNCCWARFWWRWYCCSPPVSSADCRRSPSGLCRRSDREMSLLRTVELRKRFGALNACDGVNFTVEKGEFLSLVGSNGAGKTTLVNLITAHLLPDSGQILFEDRDITTMTVAARIKAGIARSFQLVNLFDGLSVVDDVALSIFTREGKARRLFSLADSDREVEAEAV